MRPIRAPRFLTLLLLCLSGPALLGQTSQDVHITPRVKSPAPPPITPPVNGALGSKPGVSTDPSLKTYTKPLRVDVDLVLVPVTVTDQFNRLVTGLDKDNFMLAEANRLQQIKYFSSEDAPVSLGVIFDVSGSMADKIDKARDAVIEFFKTANPQDEFFLITFADKPELLQDFTSSIEDVQGRLVYAVPKGRTALFDAVYYGINKMKDAKNSKKALLIISDGGDNRSRYTDSEIKSLVREADVQIYAIGLFGNNTPEEVRGPYMLSELTDATGGRTFPISDVNELSDVAVKIGVELRNQYVLGYRPTNAARDGKWRKIKIKLNPPKGLPQLQVHAKTGYYAPQQ